MDENVIITGKLFYNLSIEEGKSSIQRPSSPASTGVFMASFKATWSSAEKAKDCEGGSRRDAPTRLIRTGGTDVASCLFKMDSIDRIVVDVSPIHRQ